MEFDSINFEFDPIHFATNLARFTSSLADAAWAYPIHLRFDQIFLHIS